MPSATDTATAPMLHDGFITACDLDLSRTITHRFRLCLMLVQVFCGSFKGRGAGSIPAVSAVAAAEAGNGLQTAAAGCPAAASCMSQLHRAQSCLCGSLHAQYLSCTSLLSRSGPTSASLLSRAAQPELEAAAHPLPASDQALRSCTKVPPGTFWYSLAPAPKCWSEAANCAAGAVPSGPEAAPHSAQEG